MIAHLYQKFDLELNKVLKYFLRFANRLTSWRETKAYEFNRLGNYNVELSSKPLIVIVVSVEMAQSFTQASGSKPNSDTDGLSPKAAVTS